MYVDGNHPNLVFVVLGSYAALYSCQFKSMYADYKLFIPYGINVLADIQAIQGADDDDMPSFLCRFSSKLLLNHCDFKGFSEDVMLNHLVIITTHADIITKKYFIFFYQSDLLLTSAHFYGQYYSYMVISNNYYIHKLKCICIGLTSFPKRIAMLVFGELGTGLIHNISFSNVGNSFIY
jgi:hypothetical protein